ncbi:MAG: fatty acid metabolism transcriptional regulator FadR [Thermodesulfobacteriota bacterium]
MENKHPLRPGPYAEQQIIENILSGQYPPGSFLPAERRLAEKLGVTRPTVREALQRLAGEGWLTIRHGKATEVNNFWETGGMRLLGTMVNYSRTLPASMIEHLLELRVIFTPPVAAQAAANAPGPITEHLEKCRSLEDEALAFTAYDWQLQERMARHSGNPVHLMLLNDFKAIFTALAAAYFSRQNARRASMIFYKNLLHAVRGDPAAVEAIVKKAMTDSIAIWKQMQAAHKEEENVSMERMG